MRKMQDFLPENINTAMNKVFLAIIFTATLITFQSCAQQPTASQLDAKQFAAMMEKTTDEWIIDVRTKKEFESGRIASAVNMDYYADDFQKQLASLPKDKPLLVYCLSGSRSNSAVERLHSMGYTNVYHLAGGIQSWKMASLPIEGESNKPDAFTENDYQQLISANRLLMIDYYAPWCLPCRKMKPFIEKLAKEFEGRVKVVQINTDEAKQLSAKLNINSIPVITFIADGKELTRLTGLQSEETLREELKKLEGKK